MSRGFTHVITKTEKLSIEGNKFELHKPPTDENAFTLSCCFRTLLTDRTLDSFAGRCFSCHSFLSMSLSHDKFHVGRVDYVVNYG